MALFTKEALVQETNVQYLDRQLDWESAYTYNSKTFGPEGTLGRDAEREDVLTRILRR